MGRPKGREFWIDDSRRKHECYPYRESEARTFRVEHEGRALDVLIVDYLPPSAIRSAATDGDLLFLLGVQLDNEWEEEGRTRRLEGGDGIVVIARKLPDSEAKYAVVVFHTLYPQALPRLGFPSPETSEG